MTRDRLNRLFRALPLIMSALALGLVVFAVITGWERNFPDEGAAAHTFQLLIVAQAPFIFGYLLTADWKRGRGAVLPVLGMQIAAICLALIPVAAFHL